MTTTNKNNKVTLNTPVDLDFSIFGGLNKSKNLHKLIFLIHQINHFTYINGTYKMHKKTHYEFLGITPNDLNKYLNILIAAGLIIQTKFGNNIKKILSEYEFVNPFEPITGTPHTYYADDVKCPVFIKRWVADGHTFKAPKASSFIKPKVKKKVICVKDMDDIFKAIETLTKTNAEQESKIKELEVQLLNAGKNSVKIERDDESFMVNEITTSTTPDEVLESFKIDSIYGCQIEVRDWEKALQLVTNIGKTKDDLIYSVRNNLDGVTSTNISIKYKFDINTDVDYAIISTK